MTRGRFLKLLEVWRYKGGSMRRRVGVMQMRSRGFGGWRGFWLRSENLRFVFEGTILVLGLGKVIDRIVSCVLWRSAAVWSGR